MTTATKTPIVDTHEVWAARRKNIRTPVGLAWFDAGKMRVTEQGVEHVAPPDFYTRALDGTTTTRTEAAAPTPTASSDVFAAIAIDDPEIKAAEAALAPRSRRAVLPISARLHSTRSASDIVLEEIAAMSTPKDADDDVIAEATRLGRAVR